MCCCCIHNACYGSNNGWTSSLRSRIMAELQLLGALAASRLQILVENSKLPESEQKCRAVMLLVFDFLCFFFFWCSNFALWRKVRTAWRHCERKYRQSWKRKKCHHWILQRDSSLLRLWDCGKPQTGFQCSPLDPPTVRWVMNWRCCAGIKCRYCR